MKKLLTVIFTTLIMSSIFAQQEGSAFTATGRGVSTTFVRDYESIDINPANLAWGTGYENKKIVVGMGEVAASVFTDAITKDDFMGSIFGGETFSSSAEKKQAAQDFTKTGFAINADVAPLSFYFYDKKLGGFAFSTKDRFQFFLKLGETTADILFNGYTADYFDSLTINVKGNIQTIANDPNSYDIDTLNILDGFAAIPDLLSNVLDGTNINVAYTREYNFSYGRNIIKNEMIEISGGIGFKLVHGYGIMRITSEDGNMEAFTSVSPDFGINFGAAASSNPSFSDSENGFPFPTKVGQGVGFDFGGNIKIKNKIMVGASITNVGSMKWDGNVYSLKDSLVTSIDDPGFESYNVVAESGGLGELDGLLEWSGQQSIRVKLPSTMRLGGSINLIDDRMHVGLDIVVPLNDAPGNYEQPIFSLGGDFRILKWIELETGMVYGGNTQARLNIPIGLTFHVGKGGFWEAGAASRDLVSYFRQKGPNMSGSFGFLRFRF